MSPVLTHTESEFLRHLNREGASSWIEVADGLALPTQTVRAAGLALRRKDLVLLQSQSEGMALYQLTPTGAELAQRLDR